MEAILGSEKAFSYWKKQYGSKFHVSDEDKLSKRVVDRTLPNMLAKRAENDPKVTFQNDPKSSKNRCKKTIEILIGKKAALAIHLGRPGGMRWPPGGIIGGFKYSFLRFACV